MGTQIVTLTNPSFTSPTAPGGPEFTAIGVTLFTVPGFTVTVADPDFVPSWVDVALMPTGVVACTEGAVNRPEPLIEPAVADQFTVELKLPVPLTIAEHWLVWPELMLVGEQLTETPVIEEELPLLPHAAINATLPNTSNSPAVLTVYLLMNSY